MIIDRQPYNEEYIPKNKSTIKHFVWFSTFLQESNKSAEAHFQLVDHILSKHQKKVVMCHRGLGKSTKIVHLVLEWLYNGKKPNFGEFKFVLFIQDSVTMVASTFERILGLLTEPVFKNVFEIRKSRLGDDPTIHVYNKILNKTFYLRGRGSGQAIRGIAIMGQRPNIVILDDIENEDKHATKESRDRLKSWFNNAVMPSIDTNKFEFIFIGTPIHEDSLLLNLVNSNSWKAIELPVADNFEPSDLSKATTSWSDRFTPSFVKEIYEDLKGRGQETSFYQEYMLQVTPKNDLLFKMDNINSYKMLDFKDKLNTLTYYITVDLAVSEQQYADYTAIAVIGIDTSNNWFLVDGFFGRVKPDTTIEKIFYYVSKWNPYCVVLEKVAFQLSMKTFIQNEMINRGKFFNLKMVSRTKDKLSVIKGLQPLVELNRIWFPEDYIQDFVEELKHEMSMITNDKILAKHDDLVDAISQLTLIEMISTNSIIDNSNSFLYNNSKASSPYIF